MADAKRRPQQPNPVTDADVESAMNQAHHGPPAETPGRAPVSLPETGLRRMQTQGGSSSLAVIRPREIRAVEAAAKAESLMLGESAFYGWGANKDRIEGPSVKLAMAMARCWGNCGIDMLPMQETADAWVFTASYSDHETGFSFTRQFRQAKKWEVFGRHNEERKDDMRFQIGQSKAVRNIILNALPQWLVDRCLDAAKGGVRETIEGLVKEHGLPKVIEKALAKLVDKGAKVEWVLESMGRKNAASITVEDLIIIRGNITAIEAGQETVEDLYPDPSARPKGSVAASVQAAIDDKTPAKAGDTDPFARS